MHDSSVRAQPDAAPLPLPSPSVVRRIVQGLPTVLVLAALGGLAVWGHHTGWQLPRWPAWIGVEAQSDDWCAEHGVPESRCVECHPELLPETPRYGWCDRHGVAVCPLCHPDVAQLATTPTIHAVDLEQADRALAFTERPQNDRRCQLHQRRLQLASEEAAAKAGIAVDLAWREPVRETITANGEVRYDPTRLAQLSARVPGIVWRVEKQVGDPVRRGELLALIDAADVGRAKAEFLQAGVQVELQETVVANLRQASGVLPERQWREAEATLRGAQIRLALAEQALINLGLPARAKQIMGLTAEAAAQRLRFLGLPEEISPTLDPDATTDNLLPIYAPLDGVVIACSAVAGEVVDTHKVLFTVADTRRLWLMLAVPQESARQLAVGQTVEFRPDGAKTPAAGTIAWISTEVDEKSRTIAARVHLDNDNGQLRANTFGMGVIVLRAQADAVVVPNEAIHWEGCCHVVFVRDKHYVQEEAPKVFHVRQVRPGAVNAWKTEIIAGLLPGEYVATTGSGVLLTELRKANLGEG
ncbi:MAG: efflux RND transporter periplasmic adaptor subunit [Gemmataceae bacterium]